MELEQQGCEHVEGGRVDHGAGDGSAGICEGSLLAARVASAHPELKLYLNFCGGPLTRLAAGLIAPVTVPSLHFVSNRDHLYSFVQLTEIAACAGDSAVMVLHSAGHAIPSLQGEILEAVRRALGSARGCFALDIPAAAPSYEAALPHDGASDRAPEQPQPKPDSLSLFARAPRTDALAREGHLMFVLMFATLASHHSIDCTPYRVGRPSMVSVDVPTYSLVSSAFGGALTIGFMLVCRLESVEPIGPYYIPAKLVPLVVIIVGLSAIRDSFELLGAPFAAPAAALEYGHSELWFLLALLLFRAARFLAFHVGVSPKALAAVATVVFFARRLGAFGPGTLKQWLVAHNHCWTHSPYILCSSLLDLFPGFDFFWLTYCAAPVLLQANCAPAE